MKKLFMVLFVALVASACETDTHYHDGKYHAELDFFGVPFSKMDYIIKGNEITIDNSVAGISKLQCRQYQDRIEYIEKNGMVKVLPILENGDIKVNDEVILKKVE